MAEPRRALLVHPSPLMYSELYLRLEPLGLERVATALKRAGNRVRMVDLQVYSETELWDVFGQFRPDAVGFSLNYLANVPEVIDLAKGVKARRPGCKVFVGGHSVSFIAEHVLSQAGGAIDAVLRGEGEGSAPALMDALWDGGLHMVPVAEPGVFLVDDVAFIHPEHWMEIGRAIERRRVRKEYYLETRCDVLVRNEEVFAYWRRLGLNYMSLGIESLTNEGLEVQRKELYVHVPLRRSRAQAGTS